MVYMDRYSGPWTEEEAAHLARRAGFGARPDEISELTSMGLQGAVSSRVDYDPVDQALEDQIASLRDFENTMRLKNPEDDNSLQGWWLYRMVHTNQPLQEQFTLFLHDHFVSDWPKVNDEVSDGLNDGNDGSLPEEQNCTGGSLAPDENRKKRTVARLLKTQNDLLRTRGHGAFRDLVLAVTRDPAMLLYLDNRVNYKGRAQENYARELMELFTMGVGNYSEDDVREVARALTGESVKTACSLDYPYTYYFHSNLHDRDPKTVFGVTFNQPGRGQDTEFVVDLVMHRVSNSGISPAHARLPATAIFMAWKFITWFVSEDIRIDHPAVVELAEKFYREKPNGYIYDVRECLRTLFESTFFYDAEYRFGMFKHPADFVVNAVRQLDVEETDYTGTMRSYMASMGMRLFAPPNVAGWNHGRAWINSTNLIERFNYANRLSRRVIMHRARAQSILDSGYARDENDHDGIIEFLRARLIQQPLSGDEMDVLRRFAAEVTGGRDVFRRKVNGLVHIMMTMPKYQLK
ncbi:MAG: DUF1800 family protein [bacterium]|nr:DUF1800 family protein [bacterium]